MRLPACLFTLFFAAGLAAQSVPTAINYQGRLTDNTPSQTPVTAIVPMKFAIFDALTGGNQKWLEPNPVYPGCTSQTAENVAVNQGIFSVALGAYCFALPAAIFTGTDSVRYLEITVNPGTPQQEILAPRQRITAAAYAHLAENANSAGYATSAATAASAAAVPWSGITGMPTGFADGVDNGVSSVATGSGLSGGPITAAGTVDLNLNTAGGLSKTLGAGSNELGIAAGGVAQGHLSAAGSTSGQALVSTGSAVAWGVPSLPPRKFYLTNFQVNGSQALTSCATGYHMASIWEVLNVSTLLYDPTLGITGGDQGAGLPFRTIGWIRTGGGIGDTSNTAGAGNCNLWSSALNTDYGTAAMVGVTTTTGWLPVIPSGGTAYNLVSPWSGTAYTCNLTRSVWCVQN